MSFPVGNSLNDGDYQIVDRLRGSYARGQYVGIGPNGTCLISLAKRVTIAYADAARTLELPVEGVTPLTYMGPLEGGDEGEVIDAIAETMPGGKATSLGVPLEHALVLSAHAAEIAARAHALQVVIGGLRPELIFWEEHPARISGLIPRGATWMSLASPVRDVDTYAFDEVYAAPEHLNLSPSTAASDVFELATTIATWFGRYPFGAGFAEQLMAIKLGKASLDHVPAPVRPHLTRAFAVDPKARLTMRALADGLRALVASAP